MIITKKIIAFVLFAIIVMFIVHTGKGSKVTPGDYMKQIQSNNVVGNFMHQTLTDSKHRQYYNVKDLINNGDKKGFQYLQ